MSEKTAGVHLFTYGSNHSYGLNAYTTIAGVNSDAARRIQVALHGYEWAFQYESGEEWDSIVERFSLREVEHVRVVRHSEHRDIEKSR